MDVPPISARGPEGSLPSSGEKAVVGLAFGPIPSFVPVEEKEVLSKLSKPVSVGTDPSYALAARAVINAAAAEQK
jgi:hypothetical protein